MVQDVFKDLLLSLCFLKNFELVLFLSAEIASLPDVLIVKDGDHLFTHGYHELRAEYHDEFINFLTDSKLVSRRIEILFRNGLVNELNQLLVRVLRADFDHSLGRL